MFIILGQFPLLVIHFWKKCYVALSLRDKETTQLHALLTMHNLDNRCKVIDHQQFWKAVMGLFTDHDVPLLFRKLFPTEGQTVKFVSYINSHYNISY